MIPGGGALSLFDARRLSALHRATMPASVLGRMGDGTLRRYYRWVARSPSEHLFIAREQEDVIGAAVVSTHPATVIRRFVGSNPVPFGWSAAAAFVRDGGFRREVRAFLTDRADHGGSSAPEVLQIFVTSERRGQHTGTTLLAQVEQWLRAHGERRYVVRTLADDNEATLGFYSRRGFQTVGARRFCGVRYLVLEQTL